ncbi:hypothetical protein [Rhodoblastus sp.]|jgi:molybdopterin/thiamine biosynthesis adenylyltransferase|uniref:hypothetical protein n=1 Tax=Rhodoblastus sp. TaxID=1962975 RepID=UPI0025DEB3F7|nr:hypothetical protein [Rhodoblastus sp.]
MTAHLRHSRIAKALTDRKSNALSFTASEALLRATRVAIVVGDGTGASPAAQAAALTAMATAVKCFGSAVIVVDGTTPLTKPMRCGATLGDAARFFGATVRQAAPSDATHVIVIGEHVPERAGVFVRCWWDGWTAGVVPAWDDRPLGGELNPLSGVAAGALAIREVFASMIGNQRASQRASIVSLWEPWQAPEKAEPGPAVVCVAAKLWFVGLGHLGQGYLWSLALLPGSGENLVLQDDQKAGEENEATGLLTYGNDVGRRKTRVAASWLEPAWETALIERRHQSDICLTDDDPAIVFAGLDNVPARFSIARAAFDYMIDAGVGHGPVDFESLQLRVLRKGTDPAAQWSAKEKTKDVEVMLDREVYRDYIAKHDRCGAFELAEGSVAVPFVGAFVGALGIAQGIRIASGRPTAEFLQAELGAPSMTTAGRMHEKPNEPMKRFEIRVGQVQEIDAASESPGEM